MSERVMHRQIGGGTEEKAERVGIRKRATGDCGENDRPPAAREESADQHKRQEYVCEEIHS